MKPHKIVSVNLTKLQRFRRSGTFVAWPHPSVTLVSLQHYSKSPQAVAMMRAIKGTRPCSQLCGSVTANAQSRSCMSFPCLPTGLFDPNSIMNPYKTITQES